MGRKKNCSLLERRLFLLKKIYPGRLQVSVHEDEFGLADVGSDDQQTSSHLSSLELKKKWVLQTMTKKTRDNLISLTKSS